MVVSSFLVQEINFLTVTIPNFCFDTKLTKEINIKLNSDLYLSGILSIIF